MHWYFLPFSFLFNVIVTLRNKFFDWGWFASKEFNIPIINVGNITVGGTGKTPHVEYLIRQLEPQYAVATISRGYKRKTKGYLEATTQSKVSDVGDEPLQIKQKYQNTQVIVDEKRVHAVETLLAAKKAPEVILLDDAFQHRHITPGLNILLVDYHNPITKDYLLPAGRLREPAHNRDRAHIVIVTKCPDNLNPIDFRIMSKELNLFPYQNLFFTNFSYHSLISVFGNHKQFHTISDLKGIETLVVTGIANPTPIYTMLEKKGAKLTKLAFSDHHNFTAGDINKIVNAFMGINNKHKVVLCTEKDAVRLKTGRFAKELSKLPIYALPIEVSFLNDEELKFRDLIANYMQGAKPFIC